MGMEQEENIYAKIQEILGGLHGNFNILEEQISIDTQMAYFEFSNELKNKLSSDETILNKDAIFSTDISLDEKKTMLVHLASIDKVEAFRVLEQYQQKPDPELKDWAVMAFQESKMLMESSLLDQNQVFISTGLGGKGSKLRYFVVFIKKTPFIFEDYQKKTLKNEIEISFRKRECIVEQINFTDQFAICKMLIPIREQFNVLFEEIIDNANQLGDFLEQNFIVTNVKELTTEEILDVLNNSKTKKDPNSDQPELK